MNGNSSPRPFLYMCQSIVALRLLWRLCAHMPIVRALAPSFHAIMPATGAQLNRNGRSVTFGNAVRKGGLLRGERSGFAGCGMLPWPEPFLLKRGQRQQKNAMTP